FLLFPCGAAAVAWLGAVIEPLLLRPFYRRAEEYQLLVTFGLLLILEDVMRFFWGGLPLTADPLMDVLPSIRFGGLIYPGYNLVVIGVGVVADHYFGNLVPCAARVKKAGGATACSCVQKPPRNRLTQVR